MVQIREINEEIIAQSFRCYQGRADFLGVKSPWWAKLMEPEDNSEEVKVNLWRPTNEQISIAERLLFDIFLQLEEADRKVLIIRCGKGYIKSYRKCGKEMGIHHEVFRQLFQQVIEKLRKILDE